MNCLKDHVCIVRRYLKLRPNILASAYTIDYFRLETSRHVSNRYEQTLSTRYIGGRSKEKNDHSCFDDRAMR